MYATDIMVSEHEMITRMLKVMRKACLGILKGEKICYKDFEKMTDFVKNFADDHHHGKEEKFLFKEMEARLGGVGQKLIRHGMLVEHDLGRLYMSQLKEALERVKAGDEESKLDVIANAIGYADLLTRHIAKENQVVYTFADKQLTDDVKALVNEQTKAFEEVAEASGIQKHYLELLEELELKY